jgi:hypothetical protein
MDTLTLGCMTSVDPQAATEGAVNTRTGINNRLKVRVED